MGELNCSMIIWHTEFENEGKDKTHYSSVLWQ
jgi:hypothetical protein